MNGGGAVTLRFQRSPLRAAARTVRLLPWNRLLAVDPVVMAPAGSDGGDPAIDVVRVVGAGGEEEGGGMEWDGGDADAKVINQKQKDKKRSVFFPCL